MPVYFMSQKNGTRRSQEFQGRGRGYRISKIVVMPGWQSGSTGGPKGGWSCAFGVVVKVVVVTSPCGVVLCTVACLSS